MSTVARFHVAKSHKGWPDLAKKTDIRSLLVAMLFSVATNAVFAEDEIDQMMSLWDYSDPAATELVFLSMKDDAKKSSNSDYYPALVTQIARTFSLRGEYDLANQQLQEANKLIADHQSKAWVYFLLESGRSINSSGDDNDNANGEKEKARVVFEEAFKIAEQAGYDYLAVDAAHMVAITAPLDEQMDWSNKALEVAENSESPRARKWLAVLYNNMGWTYFDQGSYPKALSLFEKAVQLRKVQKKKKRIRIARWAVARTYRAMGRLDEARNIQLDLLDETERAGLAADGYVLEELGELYLQDNPEKSRDYFARAYRILSQDQWLAKNEPQRLKRMKSLAVNRSPQK